jgi:hypothetical protein
MKALGFFPIALAAVLFVRPAGAQEHGLLTSYGMEAMIGGGVAGFSAEELRDVTTVGGEWETRFVFGTRTLLGIEAAYVGGAYALDALGLDDNAYLLTTGIEASARLNLLPGALQPFVVAGVGWKRYDVTNADVNTSAMEDEDDVVEIPLGVGLAYRFAPLFIEARGVFRPALDNDLIATGELHNWAASARVGFEF